MSSFLNVSDGLHFSVDLINSGSVRLLLCRAGSLVAENKDNGHHRQANRITSFMYIATQTLEVQCSSLITLCLDSIEMAHVISELCSKGIILQRNYRKMTILWSFSYNYFVKFHGKRFGSHNFQICVKVRCIIMGLHCMSHKEHVESE